ncbi:hypothetical protein [Corynebacterium sp. KPL2838]|uniref:hypothetical protein n=1 Tax=Corynebacterium sp. KPL2838 TaxID=3158316 RepID=UPI0032EB0AAA
MYLPVTHTGLVPATASGDAALVEELPEGVGTPEMVDIGTLHVFACPEAIARGDRAAATCDLFRR